ncbi:MAG: hypothetical protein E4H36_15970, partial [Spirochaetales bacterium]
MDRNRSHSITLCAVIVLSVIVSAGCGVRFGADLPGSKICTVRYELTGSSSVQNCFITLYDSDMQAATYDGVSLPWTHEYTIDCYYPSYYYSIQAESSDLAEKAGGSILIWNETSFTDIGASFLSTAAAGDYVLNKTDDVYAQIISVDSDSSLTLDSACFCEDKRTYIICQNMKNKVSGSATSFGPNTLTDEAGLFVARMVAVGDLVFNLTTGEETEVAAVEDAKNLTLLDANIFTADGERYAVYGAAGEITGTSELPDPMELKDTAQNFLSVSPGAVAAKGTVHAFTDFARVLAVTETELTLDKDIFSAGGENYSIFNYARDAAVSTSHCTEGLIDSGASFYTDATTHSLVYNSSTGSYAEINGIVSDTELAFLTDLFPERAVE